MSNGQMKTINENAQDNIADKEEAAPISRNRARAFIVPAAIVLASLLAFGLIVHGIVAQEVERQELKARIEEEYKFLEGDESGYTAAQVGIYEKLRVMDLLDENGMRDYDAQGATRDYHYVAADYAKVEGLDDTYLYGFYVLAGAEDANEMAIALGYEGLDDFMIQNGYVDENGNPSTHEWWRADVVQMREIMVSLYGKNEKSE